MGSDTPDNVPVATAAAEPAAAEPFEVGESVVFHESDVSSPPGAMVSLTSTVAIVCYADVENGGHGRCSLLSVDEHASHTAHVDGDPIRHDEEDADDDDDNKVGSHVDDPHTGSNGGALDPDTIDSHDGKDDGRHTPHMTGGAQLKVLDSIVLHRPSPIAGSHYPSPAVHDVGLMASETTESTTSLAVTRMSDTSTAVCYRNEAGDGVCKLLSIITTPQGQSLGKASGLRETSWSSAYMEVGSAMSVGAVGGYMSLTRLSETTVAWCHTEADDASGACQQLRLVNDGQEWEVASDVLRFNTKTAYLSVAALTASTAAVCYQSIQASEFSECKVVDFAAATAGPAMPLTTGAAAHYLSMVPQQAASAPAHSHLCGHPPPQKPTSLLRDVLSPRAESRCRLAAEERLLHGLHTALPLVAVLPSSGSSP